MQTAVRREVVSKKTACGKDEAVQHQTYVILELRLSS